MKITPRDQAKMEELMTAQAIKRGATSLSDWIVKAREAIVAGEIPAPKTSEAIMIFSYLMHGEALDYLCKVIYEYANDSHMATFQKNLFAKHAK